MAKATKGAQAPAVEAPPAPKTTDDTVALFDRVDGALEALVAITKCNTAYKCHAVATAELERWDDYLSNDT